MVKKEISFRPIGLVHSPLKTRENIDPLRNVRPSGFSRVEGVIEVFKPYAPGLKDIDGFSHLIVIFAFHQSQKGKLLVKPPLETALRGVFSTRSPHRPNPIGLTIVRLLSRTKNALKVSGLDMLDGSPVLDIKPYTRRDSKRRLKLGWLEKRSQGKKED